MILAASSLLAPPLHASRGVLMLGALLLASGCTTAVVEQGASEAETTETLGFVTIESSTDPAADEPSLREHASATFVRTRDAQNARVVARLLGAIPTLPAPGQCMNLDVDDPSLALHTLSAAELLHVGDVSLAQSPLMARAYPDVAHLVSGVVYTSPDIGAVLPRQRERVMLRVGGANDVTGFELELDVPEPLSNVSLNGVTLRETAALERLAPGAVNVTWSEDGVGDDELVFLDFAWETPARSQRVRCVADGQQPLISLDAPTTDEGTLVLSLHRLKTLQAPAGSLSTTEIRLDTAVNGRVAFGHPG